ncbi:tyrosine-type recombinase/integrase [Sneathiella sp.]|jgi:integrase|uniref:tyrosine-type recombinase/integrase n=1 Tax=Sneathiella sp. TaxID=1964365 RepID=UPI0039E49945
MANYLKLRGKKFYFTISIPGELQNYYDGKKEITKALKTDSEEVARPKALLLAADFKKQFQDLENGTVHTLQLPEIRSALKTAANDEDYRAAQEALLDMVDVVNPPHRPTSIAAAKAQTLYKQAHCQATEILSLKDQFVKEHQNLAPKTMQAYLATLNDFAALNPVMEEVTLKDASNFLVKPIIEENKSPATIKRWRTALRQFFAWAIKRGLVEKMDNPFAQVELPKSPNKEKNTEKPHREFTNEEVEKLLQHIPERDPALKDLTILGMYSGARIEEISRIKKDHVNLETKTILVDVSKTQAGIRHLPIVSAIEPLVRKLMETSKNEYLLDNLTWSALNVNGERIEEHSRSKNVGKRFNRLRQKLEILGTSNRVCDFHSFRATVAGKLERAGCPEGIAADILGHERNNNQKLGITYGLYADPADIHERRKWLEKIIFSS